MAESKIVLITGCNRGIGLEMTRQYVAAGAKVIGVYRSSNADLEQLKLHKNIVADVSKQSGIDAILEALGDEKLDIVIHNAGVFPSDKVDTLSFEALEQGYLVNAMAPLVLSSALLKSNLKPGSKLAFNTSRMGSIADNGSGGSYSYRMSKAALNMGAFNLSKDLKAREIIIGILHPGMVETDMTTAFGMKAGVGLTITPQYSVEKILAKIDDLTLENSGTFFHCVTGEKLPW